VHACEATQLHEGITIFWTLCEIDVNGGAATALVEPAISCPICRERMQEPVPSVVPDAGEAETAMPGAENFDPLLLRKPGL
jgi:hypothetical protein